MKRFKTVNTEAPKNHIIADLLYLHFTYTIQMRVRVCVLLLLYGQIICLQIIDAKHTRAHKLFGFVFHASPTNQPADRILCESKSMYRRARVTNNLDEKISQVGIFSLMGNLYYSFSRIFGIWWAHITGNHHMSLENADKAKMWVRVCACVYETPVISRPTHAYLCKSLHSHWHKTHFVNLCVRALYAISWISMLHIKPK